MPKIRLECSLRSDRTYEIVRIAVEKRPWIFVREGEIVDWKTAGFCGFALLCLNHALSKRRNQAGPSITAEDGEWASPLRYALYRSENERLRGESGDRAKWALALLGGDIGIDSFVAVRGTGSNPSIKLKDDVVVEVSNPRTAYTSEDAIAEAIHNLKGIQIQDHIPKISLRVLRSPTGESWTIQPFRNHERITIQTEDKIVISVKTRIPDHTGLFWISSDNELHAIVPYDGKLGTSLKPSSKKVEDGHEITFPIDGESLTIEEPQGVEYCIGYLHTREIDADEQKLIADTLIAAIEASSAEVGSEIRWIAMVSENNARRLVRRGLRRSEQPSERVDALVKALGKHVDAFQILELPTTHVR